MFTYYQNEEDYNYYLFKEKLSNNQTLEMKFLEFDTFFWVATQVYSKRKHNYSEQITTGKVGLESLILAKLGIKLFIEFLIEQKISKKIVIGWADNRRKNVYYRGLKELGFKFEYLIFENITKKYLTKNI